MLGPEVNAGLDAGPVQSCVVVVVVVVVAVPGPDFGENLPSLQPTEDPAGPALWLGTADCGPGRGLRYESSTEARRLRARPESAE